MAYSDIALLSADNDFIMRTRACYANETTSEPIEWAEAHQWQMASMPGFGDKYSYALANGVYRPGNDPSVISDSEILSAVQALIAGDGAAESP